MIQLTQPLIIALIELGAHVSLGAISVLLKRLNTPNPTIEDAIAAFDEAAKKSAEDYLAEARERAKLGTLPPQ